MVLGVVWAKKRYTCVKYAFVVMITIGVAVFMYQPTSAAVTTRADGDHTLSFGECLLVCSIFIFLAN